MIHQLILTSPQSKLVLIESIGFLLKELQSVGHGLSKDVEVTANQKEIKNKILEN